MAIASTSLSVVHGGTRLRTDSATVPDWLLPVTPTLHGPTHLRTKHPYLLSMNPLQVASKFGILFPMHRIDAGRTDALSLVPDLVTLSPTEIIPILLQESYGHRDQGFALSWTQSFGRNYALHSKISTLPLASSLHVNRI
jgi:hypothetical protein